MALHDSESGVRHAAVAGQFYPGSAEELSRNIDQMLRDCGDSTGKSRVRALISPHAGYVYSGPTAAKAFSLLRGLKYRNVIVLAPSHRMYIDGLALSRHTAFRTPLGDIPVDSKAVEAILNSSSPFIQLRDKAHDAEHSLEVQLPFIQRTLPGTPIVPIVCGQLDEDSELSAAKALIDFWTPETLWVISSDFTHFGESFGYVPFREEVEDNLKKLDMGAANKIIALDREGFINYLQQSGATICGANPIRILLRTINLSHIKPAATIVDYTNSGEISGDFSHCVGYCSIAFSD